MLRFRTRERHRIRGRRIPAQPRSPSTCAHDGTSSQYCGTASQAAAASPSLSSESGGTASKREFVSLVILSVILRRFSHGLEGLVAFFSSKAATSFVLCLLEQLLEKLEAHLAPFSTATLRMPCLSRLRRRMRSADSSCLHNHRNVSTPWAAEAAAARQGLSRGAEGSLASSAE